ncbi:sialidase family protein [Streptomyces sp. NPDC089799]|uniref:sialidase family protein n=1 Tax=Streptomyces sp. NPDC089799 TaxID=3155066 RepID=UPI00343FA85A
MTRQRSVVRFRWEIPVLGGILALAVLIVGIVALLGNGGGSDGAEKKGPSGPLRPEVSTPFRAFSEGYDCFRIPTLTSTRNGNLLAIAEARTKSCSDIGDIDLVMKRSTDNGKTWGKLQVIRGADDSGGFGNPVPMVDAESGRLTLIYAYNDWSAGPKGDRVRAPRELRMAHSTDNGATWTAALTQLDQLKRDDWAWVSVGPGHGIQLQPTRSGKPGRMVVTGDYRTRDEAHGAMLYYSDDGGLTWQLGASWDAPQGQPAPGEPAITQLPDGHVYINARSLQTCGTNDHRVSAVIDEVADPSFPDRGFEPVSNLPAPPVSGSLLQLPDGGPLLFSSPARQGGEFSDRWTLAVRTSADGGKTWSAKGAVVARDRAGYSDMTLLRSGDVGLLYETGTTASTGSVVFTSFAPAALGGASEDLTPRRTSDNTPNKNHALVHGDPQLVPRADGKALSLNGSSDFLRIGCSDSLRVAGGDFAVTAWVKFSGQSGRRPLIWASGQNASAKQLVVEAVDGRIEARTNSGGRPVQVSTMSRFDDDRWHHVAFQRLGSQLQLSVDGGYSQTADLRPEDMNIQPDDAFTVYVGTQPDQKVFFAGALDDVRITGRALTKEDLGRIRADENAQDPQDRLRLLFTAIW